MTVTVYHLKSCDSCRKAIKALKEAGYDLSLIDVRAGGLSPAQLQIILERVGWQKALNRRSTSWRALSDDQKEGLDEARAAELIIDYPTLLKRPVVMTADQATIGWGPAEQALWLDGLVQ